MRPQDEEAQQAYAEVHGYKNFLLNLLLMLVAIAILAAAAYGALMFLRKRREAQRVSNLTTSSDYDSAIPELEHLAAQKPQDKQLAIKLADMYVAAERYSPQSIPVLQKVRADPPEDGRYTLAL